MIRFVGGLPRTGRTTFASSLNIPRGTEFIDTSRVPGMLPENPGFDPERDYLGEEFAQWGVKVADIENKVWWQFTNGYARSVVASGGSALIVGGIRPDHTVGHPTKYESRSVFFVDTKMSKHALANIRDDDGINRYSSWSDEEIVIWAERIEKRSKRIVHYGSEMGAHVFDVGVLGMSDAQGLAATVMGF